LKITAPLKLLIFIVIFIVSPSVGKAEAELRIDLPRIWIKGVPTDFKLSVPPTAPQSITECTLEISGKLLSAPCSPGSDVVFSDVVFDDTGKSQVVARAGQLKSTSEIKVVHGLLTLLPPIIAIVLALAFRQVLAALWIAIWLGAFIINDWRPFVAAARSIDHYIIGSMADPGHAAMLVFIIFIGGLIGMIARSGGIQGIVEIIAARATSAVKGQAATFIMGLLIFFDDYANTIIVGSTMRPITDKLKISREKLSYIVDSTAAPVASIFPISTWIGYEVGLIDTALFNIGLPDSGYMIFIESIMYRFYPIFALALVMIVAVSGRDFGPMAKAEKRARTEGKPLRDGAEPMATIESKNMDPPDGAPHHWYNAVVPLAVVVLITFVGLWINGHDALGGAGFKAVMEQSKSAGWGWVYIVGQVFSQASPNIVLAWASLGGCIVMVIMVTFQRILSLGEAMSAWLSGVESMVIAIVVLLLAWGLGQICMDLHTAEYLTSALSGVLSPRFLPVLTFVLAGGISFATGTSYGTMAILMPLAIPIASRLCIDLDYSAEDLHMIIVGVVSSVLAGSVFGDHCSPISDTTIMSSMATSADHVDHVRTQFPYALFAAGVGVVIGDIPAAYGVHPLICIVVGLAVMIGVMYIFGSRPGSDKEPETV
jgi:Na+/H+ antiporter NhaC